jgi:hypothetical protein
MEQFELLWRNVFFYAVCGDRVAVFVNGYVSNMDNLRRLDFISTQERLNAKNQLISFEWFGEITRLSK